MGVASRHVGHDDLGSGVSQVDPIHADVYLDGDVTHRHVTDVTDAADAADAASEPVRSRASLLLRAGMGSWRHAVMMKAILDPPVSMRGEAATMDPYGL
jgi:hypothetical protein